MQTKTHIKAGALTSNHNQTLVRTQELAPGYMVQTGATAGANRKEYQESLQGIVRVTLGTDSPRIAGPGPCPEHLEEREEGNTMKPLYTLLLCLPAALGVIACGCGVAVLWPPAARPTAYKTVGRGRDRRSPA